MSDAENIDVFDFAENKKPMRDSGESLSEFLIGEMSRAASRSVIVPHIWMNNGLAWLHGGQGWKRKVLWQRIRTNLNKGIVGESQCWSVAEIRNFKKPFRSAIKSVYFYMGGTSTDISSQFPSSLVSSIDEEIASEDSYNKGKKCGEAQEKQFGIGEGSSSDAVGPKTRFRQWIGTVFGFGIIALFSGVRVGYGAKRWYTCVITGILVTFGFCCCWLTLMGAPYWI
jgi:hypothetical protein